MVVIFKKNDKVVFRSNERKIISLCKEYKDLIEKTLGYEVLFAKPKKQS